MTQIPRILVLLVAVSLTVGIATSASAEGPAVTQVVAVDTNGDADALLADAKSNAKIFERLGIQATRRYMQATLAGPESGTMAVVIEYPSLAALAAAQEKLQNDPEWQKYIAKITKSGMSVQSNSVWVDRTP